MSDSINPFCKCNPCTCSPICTCGLRKAEENTSLAWDANAMALVHTTTVTYRPTHEALASPPAESEHAHPPPAQPTVTSPENAIGELAAGGAMQQVKARYNMLDTHDHESHGSVRVAMHKGHRIEIKTHYEVSIDGQRLGAHMSVSDDGQVHYHGLPNYADASGVELIKRVIDAFPDDFPNDEAE